jgi:cystathionine beta-lyase/cystathionine gamma-synthase
VEFAWAFKHLMQFVPHRRFGVLENTICLHVGFEHVEDLWRDLELALAKI